MTRAVFVTPWRSDRFVSLGLQNVCHPDLGLGCAKFVLFLVECRPVSIHTFGGGPAMCSRVGTLCGRRSMFDVCLNWLLTVFCRLVYILCQVVLHGSTFGSCCGSQFAYQMFVNKAHDDIQLE